VLDIVQLSIKAERRARKDKGVYFSLYGPINCLAMPLITKLATEY